MGASMRGFARVDVCQRLKNGKTHVAEALKIKNRLPTEPVALYLRMPSLEMTVLYRSESYFFR
jgi:hypothetical protein